MAIILNNREPDQTPTGAEATKDKALATQTLGGARWRNRRRMAWVSLLAMLAVTFYSMGPWLPLDRLEKLETVITWFYMSCASVVGSYMAVTTWAAINYMKTTQPNGENES